MSTINAQENSGMPEAIETILVEEHQSLFADQVQELLHKVKLFGLYFCIF